MRNSLIKLIYDNGTLEDKGQAGSVTIKSNYIAHIHIKDAWPAVLGATMHIQHGLTM